MSFDFYDGLGAYGDAAPEEPPAALKIVASVGATLTKNLVKVGFSPDALFRIVSGQFLWSEASQTQLATEKAIKVVASEYGKWSTTWLKWAMNGKRDDGSVYSWALWLDGAQQIAKDANDIGGISWDSSELANSVQTLKDIGADLKKAATPSEWPLWAKVGIGLGIAAVGGIYVVPLLSAVKGASRG